MGQPVFKVAQGPVAWFKPRVIPQDPALHLLEIEVPGIGSYSVELTTLHVLDDGERLPFCYDYVPPSKSIPHPVVQIIAGPGVEIELRGFPRAGNKPNEFRALPVGTPVVLVHRVQDLRAIPPVGTAIRPHHYQGTEDWMEAAGLRYPIRPDLSRLRGSDSSGKFSKFVDRFMKIYGDAARKHSQSRTLPKYLPADQDLMVTRRSDGLRFYHPKSHSELRLKVPKTRPQGGKRGSGSDGFSYQYDPRGKSNDLQSPVLTVVKTAGVQATHVQLADDPSVWWRPDPNLYFYSILEAARIEQVPQVQSGFGPDTRWKRAPKIKLKSQPSSIEALNQMVQGVFDVVLGFIPVIGDLADVAELTAALSTGRDKWGNRVSQTHLSMMGIAVLLPFVSSRLGTAALADQLTVRSDELAPLVNELEKLPVEDLEVLARAGTKAKGGGAFSIEEIDEYMGIVGKLDLPRAPLELVVNETASGFHHPGLQSAYRDYLAKPDKTLTPIKWARKQTSGPAFRILTELFGPGFAKLKKAPDHPKNQRNLLNYARPDILTDERLLADLATMHKHDVLLKTKMSNYVKSFNMKALLREPEHVTSNLTKFNQLKGNIAEVLALPHQLAALKRIKSNPKSPVPGAFLQTGVRVQFKSGGKWVNTEFSDNVIANIEPDGTLKLHIIFEVKSGPWSTKQLGFQIFKWPERNVHEGARIVFPKDSIRISTSGKAVRAKQEAVYEYYPSTADQARVTGIISAEREGLLPSDLEAVIPEEIGIAAKFNIVSLGRTTDEINYLAAFTLARR